MKQEQIGKFNPGDIITAKYVNRGLEKATIVRKQNGNYYCSILNGTAVIPIQAVDETYKYYK